MMAKVKALCLLSGGLDSILALKLILDQGIEVMAVNFVTPFYSCEREARKIADRFGVPIKITRFKENYIDMVKNPIYGYGKRMNPCIDCRIFMFKKAKEYREEMGASFIFTGEVLDERPMSQRKEAMKIIDREADVSILRPLSARLLEETIPEKEGLVDREKFLSIHGRRRKRQMELAEQYGIEYPSPSGGCLLTDPQFANKIKESFRYEESSLNDIYLLKYGRHFRLPSGAKVIVGRNEEENRVILDLAKDAIILEVVGFGSPITLLKKGNREDIEIAASICARYSDCDGLAEVEVISNDKKNIHVEAMEDEEIEKFRI